jgi:hypothetical protein
LIQQFAIDLFSPRQCSCHQVRELSPSLFFFLTAHKPSQDCSRDSLTTASNSNMMSVSHYDREAEDSLPPRYSTRPNSTDDDDSNSNSRVRDAEEGRNEPRRSLTFVESLFVPEPVYHGTHVQFFHEPVLPGSNIAPTQVQPPPRALNPPSAQQPPAQQPPARSPLLVRLTRKRSRSKSE